MKSGGSTSNSSSTVPMISSMMSSSVRNPVQRPSLSKTIATCARRLWRSASRFSSGESSRAMTNGRARRFRSIERNSAVAW